MSILKLKRTACVGALVGMCIGLLPVILGLVGARSLAWVFYFPGLLIVGFYGIATEGSAEVAKGAPWLVLFSNIMFFCLCGTLVGYLWKSHESP